MSADFDPNALKAQKKTPAKKAQKAVDAPTFTRDSSGKVTMSRDAIESEALATGKIPAPEVTRRYWIGALPTLSVQNVHVGGQAFPRWTGVFNFDDRGQPTPATACFKGAIANLTDLQVSACMKGLGSRFVRRYGKGHQIFQEPKGVAVAGMSVQRGDLPLGQFVYMICLDDQEPLLTGWRDEYPDPVLVPMEV